MRAPQPTAYHKRATGGEWLPRANHSADIVNDGAERTRSQPAPHYCQQERRICALQKLSFHQVGHHTWPQQ